VVVFSKINSSCFDISGVLNLLNLLLIILISSMTGMFVYKFVISNEHSFVFSYVLISFRLCISCSGCCMLRVLGSCITF
jgi:hypothetical protein